MGIPGTVNRGIPLKLHGICPWPEPRQMRIWLSGARREQAMASAGLLTVPPVSPAKARPKNVSFIPSVGVAPAVRVQQERNAVLACYAPGVPPQTQFVKRFGKIPRRETTHQCVTLLRDLDAKRERQGLPKLAFTEQNHSLLRAVNEVSGFDEDASQWTVHEARAGLLASCRGELTVAAASKEYGPSVGWFDKWRPIIKKELGQGPGTTSGLSQCLS